MDERELVGLLYRADWTRLSLTGSVRGAETAVPPVFGLDLHWNVSDDDEGRDNASPSPLLVTPDALAGDIALDLAPGMRFRLTSADGRWTGGCDGSRVWQRLTGLPEKAAVGFRAEPQPPIEPLLAPSWLLTGHTLTVGEPTAVCGRPGIGFSAVWTGDRPRGGPGEWSPKPRWRRPEAYERVVGVADATLGFLLRVELRYADRDADVTEFASLAVGTEVDPSVFTAPAESFFGDGTAPGDHLGGIFGGPGREAVKTAAGLAAGALGAVVRFGPSRRVDPFKRATAEAADPDMLMPADEPLPGWAAKGTGPGGTGQDAGGTPVHDEVLHLLYRGGVEVAPFTATLHDWSDGSAMLEAVPPSARRAGFGGVGFLVDAIHRDAERDNPVIHVVQDIRFGGWERYQISPVARTQGADAPLSPLNRAIRDRYQTVTIACDGSQYWQVYKDRVEVRAATPLRDGAAELADGSWLLRCRLAGGDEVTVDGRPGYQVIATARPGAVPLGTLDWLAGEWLPAVAVVDAATGRLLRLTRYLAGRPARRLEFRSVSDGGPDDFGFTPPAGLRVVDKTVRVRFSSEA
jgi:hypothetical protein